MPEEIKNLCRLADISSKSLLLQIVRQPTPQKMTALVEKIASQGGATRAEVRQDLAKPKPGRPKAYVFNYKPENKAFNLKLKFRKGNVPRQEVIEALEAILKELQGRIVAVQESVRVRSPESEESGQVRESGRVSESPRVSRVRGETESRSRVRESLEKAAESGSRSTSDLVRRSACAIS